MDFLSHPAFWICIVAASELIALIGDAKAGRANEAVIQGSMSAILATGTFTEAELLELNEALKQGNLNSLYALS
jgi:hypothetical protein